MLCHNWRQNASQGKGAYLVTEVEGVCNVPGSPVAIVLQSANVKEALTR